MDISIENAKSLLEKGIAEAQGLINDPSQVDELLEQLENKLKDVPKIGDTLSDLPVMISMVKGYITREYSAVSPKVIAILVGSFIYFVRKKDVIPDSIPVVGIADDLAVLGLALNLCRPELEAFKEFRAGKKTAAEESAEEAVAEEQQEDLPAVEAEYDTGLEELPDMPAEDPEAYAYLEELPGEEEETAED